MKIKRYTPGIAGMIEVPEGQWVKFGDVKKLVQILDEKLDIHWHYHGNTKQYYVIMNNEEIYWTIDYRDMCLFIAELKYRLTSRCRGAE